MRTVEIPRQEWAQTLNQFTALHGDWLISLDILGPAIGAQVEISNLPLLAVTADRPDRENADILISAVRSVDEHITHTVQAATHLFIERTDDGADVALEIESSDGIKAILRLRTPALTETLDAVVDRR